MSVANSINERLHAVYLMGYAAANGYPMLPVEDFDREHAAALALGTRDAKRGAAPRPLSAFVRVIAHVLATGGSS